MLKDNIFILFFAFLGTAICLYQTSSFGVLISPDSVGYISAARSIINGDGFKIYDGSYYVIWPPLFPFLLAALGVFCLDPADVARYLNAGIFGIIIFLSGSQLNKNVHNKGLVFLGTAMFSISPVLIGISVYAWSEPLFLLLILLWLNQLQKFLNKPSKKLLIITASYAGLAMLTRYIGVVTIGLSALLILMRSNAKWLDKIYQFLLFFLLAYLPSFLWEIRTYFILGTFNSPRSPSSKNFFEAGVEATNTFIYWLIPSTPSWTLTIITIFFIALLLVELGCLSRIAISRFHFLENYLPLDKIMYSIPIYIHVLFLLIYTLFIVLLASLKYFDPLGDRLLSPVYISFWFLIIFILDQLLINMNSLISREKLVLKIAKSSVFILFGLWVFLYPIKLTFIQTENRHKEGEGYASRQWHEDEIINFLRKENLDGLIYSNAPDIISNFIGIRIYFSPGKHPGYSLDQQIQKLSEKMENEKIYLVWFKTQERKEFIFSLEELKKQIHMQSIFKSSNGEVYRLMAINQKIKN